MPRTIAELRDLGDEELPRAAGVLEGGAVQPALPARDRAARQPDADQAGPPRRRADPDDPARPRPRGRGHGRGLEHVAVAPAASAPKRRTEREEQQSDEHDRAQRAEDAHGRGGVRQDGQDRARPDRPQGPAPRSTRRRSRTSSKLAAHDETNDAHIGDTVRVMETRPLSKSKRWRVVEIVEQAK